MVFSKSDGLRGHTFVLITDRPDETLAMCNSCANLTSKLKPWSDGMPADETGIDYRVGLPNGFMLNATLNGTERAVGFYPVLNITVGGPMSMQFGIWSRDPGPMDTIAFADNTSIWFTVSVIGLSPGTPEKAGPPVAYECGMWPCIQTMHAEFENGLLKETLVPGSMVGFNLTADASSPEVYTANITSNSSVSGTSFTLDEYTLWQTGNWLGNLLTGSVVISFNGGPQWDTIVPTGDIAQGIYYAMNASASGFPDLMDNLAGSMTHYLRAAAYQPSPIKGNSYIEVSRFVVRWEWLSLPLFLLCCSLILLILIMVKTSQADLHPWGNNTIATLFHGLSERVPGVGLRDTQNRMNDGSKRLHVQLRDDQEGGYLMVDKIDCISSRSQQIRFG